MSKVEHFTRPRLAFGYRLLVGLGFLVVGTSAAIGALGTTFSTVGTKIDMYGAELDGDRTRHAALERMLDEQHARIWGNCASAAVCFSIGVGMTRDVSRLWSGEPCAQVTTGEPYDASRTDAAHQPERAEAEIIYVDFGKNAA